MKQTTDQSDGWGFVIGLAAGAAMGVGLALLYAPKQGKQLRQDLSDSATELRRRVADQFNRAQDAADQAVERGRTLVDEAVDAIEETAGDVVGKATEFYDRSRAVAVHAVQEAPRYANMIKD